MGKKGGWVAAVVAVVSFTGVIIFFSAQGKVAAVNFEKAKQVSAAGNPVEVIGLLEKAHLNRLKPEKRAEALALLGKSYLAQGNLDKARKTWEEILALPKREKKFKEEAQYELAKLNKEKDPEGAFKLFTQLSSSAQEMEVAAGSLLEVAQAQEKAGNFLAARENYKKISDKFPGCSVMAAAIKGLGDTNIRLLFSKIETPYATIHVVKSGESLALIAKKYNMTLELLTEANGITNNSIHRNDRLKVCTAQFSILIDKSQNTLTLKANEELFKVYQVGTGKEGSTPIGDFKVTNKISQPTWFHPKGGGVIPFGSKENLLGTRWLGINSPGYGIHGTWEPDSVGKQSSAGCIRLRNEEVEELFKIVPAETPVTIVE